MPDPISYENAILPPGLPVGVLFPGMAGKFLFRQSVQAPSLPNRNEAIRATPQDQGSKREDVLIRLPSIRSSKQKVTVLQRWTGRVVRVMSDHFLAVLDDKTNPQNPLEEVELDVQEISKSDRPLLVEGACFYWAIGYRDNTLSGQRERISALRFARQPLLSQADEDRILEEADKTVALLASD